jgi:hypothetical protein
MKTKETVYINIYQNELKSFKRVFAGETLLGAQQTASPLGGGDYPAESAARGRH